MLSCLTIAPSDKGGDCGPLLRIVPEDAAKSGRRSDEDWAVVWGSGGVAPSGHRMRCTWRRARRGHRFSVLEWLFWVRGAASPSGRVRCFTHDFTQTLPGGLKRTARRTRENPKIVRTALFRRPPPNNLFLQCSRGSWTKKRNPSYLLTPNCLYPTLNRLARTLETLSPSRSLRTKHLA